MLHFIVCTALNIPYI